jgi:PST family polysaccharide transporter
MSTRAHLRTLLPRLAGFGLFPVISVLVPLLVLPVVAHVTGVAGWAAVGMGQSAGAVAAVVVGYGWSLEGPIQVARADDDRVRELWYEFLCASALLLVCVGLISWGLLSLVAPPDTVGLATVVAIAASLAGVSPDWMATGLAEPRLVLLYSVLPRTVLLLAAVPLMLSSGHAEWYAAGLGIGPLIGLVAFSRRRVRPRRLPGSPVRVATGHVARNFRTALTSIAGSAYSNGVMLIVGSFAPVAQTAQIASIDRVFRLLIQGIGALGRALQAWVVEPSDEPAGRRQRFSLALHTVVGLVGLVVLVALGRGVTGALFGSANKTGSVACAAYGVAFAALALNSSMGRHILLPLGRLQPVMVSTLLGALVGVPAIALGAHHAGASGAAVGFALSECLVTAVQATAVYLPRRGGRPAT